jgi:hypothetical protein
VVVVAWEWAVYQWWQWPLARAGGAFLRLQALQLAHSPLGNFQW